MAKKFVDGVNKAKNATVLALAIAAGTSGCAPDQKSDYKPLTEPIHSKKTSEPPIPLSAADEAVIRGILKNSTYIPIRTKIRGNNKDTSCIETDSPESAEILLKKLQAIGYPFDMKLGKTVLLNYDGHSDTGTRTGIIYYRKDLTERLNAIHKFEKQFGSSIKIWPESQKLYTHMTSAKTSKNDAISKLLRKANYEEGALYKSVGEIIFPDHPYKDALADATKLASLLNERFGDGFARVALDKYYQSSVQIYPTGAPIEAVHAFEQEVEKGYTRSEYMPKGLGDFSKYDFTKMAQFESEYGRDLIGEEMIKSMQILSEAKSRNK